MKRDPTKAVEPAVMGYEFERMASINCDEPESWLHLKGEPYCAQDLEVNVPDETSERELGKLVACPHPAKIFRCIFLLLISDHRGIVYSVRGCEQR